MAEIGGKLPKGYARVKVYGVDPVQIVVSQESGKFATLLEGLPRGAFATLKEVEAHIGDLSKALAIEAVVVYSEYQDKVPTVTPARVRRIGSDWISAKDGSRIGFPSRVCQPNSHLTTKLAEKDQKLTELRAEIKATIKEAKELARQFETLPKETNQ